MKGITVISEHRIEITLFLFSIMIFIFFISESAMGITSWIFRNNDYKKKNIEIKPYILTEEQMCGFFSGDNIIQYSYEKLRNKNNYLVICIKNTGNKVAWGTLECNVENRFTPKIDMGHLIPTKSRFLTYVIPLTGLIYPKNDVLPNIEVKWEKLYCK